MSLAYTITKCFSVILVLRYMVATGVPYYNGQKTEIVDLTDSSISCVLDETSHINMEPEFFAKNKKFIKCKKKNCFCWQPY